MQYCHLGDKWTLGTTNYGNDSFYIKINVFDARSISPAKKQSAMRR